MRIELNRQSVSDWLPALRRCPASCATLLPDVSHSRSFVDLSGLNQSRRIGQHNMTDTAKGLIHYKAKSIYGQSWLRRYVQYVVPATVCGFLKTSLGWRSAILRFKKNRRTSSRNKVACFVVVFCVEKCAIMPLIAHVKTQLETYFTPQ